MSKTVEFYFDVGSPTSFLAYTQLPKLCAETATELVYRPILLGGVFKATGNASPNAVPAKARYMLQDLERFTKRYDVALRFNPYFPINTLSLMRAVTGVQLRQPDRFGDFLAAVFRGMWEDGLNFNDPGVIAGALIAKGFNPQEIFALTEDEVIKTALKENTELAVKRGVFGAPSIFVGDQLFFGQDRLDFVREALS